jgi:hypothetical protein
MNSKYLFIVCIATPFLLGASLFGNKSDVRAIDDLPSPYKASPLAIGAQNDINNRFVVQDPAPVAELEVYLNNKLSMIKKSVGMESVPGRVVLTASPSLNAITSADGNIFVGIGFILNLSTEDEIIALLSHEFAHAVFNHTSSDIVAKSQQNLINITNQANSFSQKFGGVIGATTGTNTNDINKYLRNADLTLQVTKTVILPAWQREQETQADFLAIDITQKLGYSYSRGVKSFLELLQVEDEQERQLRQAKKKEYEENFAASLGESDNKSEVTTAIKGLGLSMQGMFEGIFAKSHYTAAKRLDKCNDYYEQHYGDEGKYKQKTTVHEKEWAAVRARGSIKSSLDSYKSTFEADDRLDVLEYPRGLELINKSGKSLITNHPYRIYVLARAYILNGDYARFEQTTNQAVKSGQPSWRLVQLNADYELSKGNRERATLIYEQEFNRRGKPINAMPDMHEIYVKTGNSNKANQMQMQCQFGEGKNSKECTKGKGKK